MKSFHIHLMSDSTGETVSMLARACLVQFHDIDAVEHLWSMVRSLKQVEQVVEAIRENPGFVLYTVVDATVRQTLEDACRELQIPCIPVLEPVMAALGAYLDAEVRAQPGQQHVMDSQYFERIEAMHFVFSHDDGQMTRDLDTADVVLLGVSRTSKTPTCIYLANRGIKAANVPIVPGCPLPDELFSSRRPLFVGLTKDPKRLVEIRRQRLHLLDNNMDGDYVDLETVTREVNDAKKLFARCGWPVINVSRKSIEETAAAVLQLMSRREENRL